MLPRWALLAPHGARRLAAVVTALALSLLLAVPLLGGEPGDLLAGAASVAFCWVFLVVFVRAHRLQEEERDWLVAICLAAFMTRVLLSLLILVGPWDRYVFGEDQRGYDYIPMSIARSWTGETMSSGFEASEVVQSRRGYFSFVALQYYVLGPALVMPRIFNGLAGSLLVFYVVWLARRVFGPAEARLAGLWTAFFPSLITWSAVNLRDIWLALSVLVIVCHAFALRDKFSLWSVAVVVGHLVWVHYNRAYLVLILVTACIAVFVFSRTTSILRDVAVAVVLAGVVVTLYSQMGLGREGIEWLDLERIAEQREKLARSDVGRSGYLQDIDITSPAALLVSFPVLLVYFLFSPFPWQMLVARRLITAPEMVFWYWLTPFVARAFGAAVRERGGRRLALLMTLAVVTVAFAVPSANMGLAYRYRAQIIPLFLPFAAAGFLAARRRRLATRLPAPPAGRGAPPRPHHWT